MASVQPGRIKSVKDFHSMRIRLACRVAATIAVAALLVASSAVARDGDDDADLLKEARGLFEPLPKDMATTEFPVTPGAFVWVGRCSSTRASSTEP